MTLLLSVSATGLDNETLQVLTRSLCQDLRNEAGIESSIAKESAGHGTKGQYEIIGQILVPALGAGGVIVALVNVLKTYIERKPSLEFKIHRQNGVDVEIRAEDLRRNDMTQLVQMIKKAIEDV
jgi:Effector Associated Constant Component 1